MRLHIESLTELNITKLKEWGYLDKSNRGVLNWSINGEKIASIRIRTEISEDENYIQLSYVANKETDYNYRIYLDKVETNLKKGFYRWFFICPKTYRNVMKLYLFNERFVSRFALPPYTYGLQREPKSYRYFKNFYGILEDKGYQLLYSKYLKTHYRGKETPRYKKAIHLIAKDEYFAGVGLEEISKILKIQP